jgi:hypothetical protein
MNVRQRRARIVVEQVIRLLIAAFAFPSQLITWAPTRLSSNTKHRQVSRSSVLECYQPTPTCWHAANGPP